LPEVLRSILDSSVRERSKSIDRLILNHRNRFITLRDDVALFLYRGGVASSICVAGDFNNWDARSSPMRRLPGTDLHYLELEVPPDSRVEYKFVRDGEWILDPLNPQSVSGKFGQNSVLTMPKYVELWSTPEVPRRLGTLRRLDLANREIASRWDISTYVPEAQGPASMLLVLGGSDYWEYGGIGHVVDQATLSGATKHLVAILADPKDRAREYGMPRSCCQFLARELVPEVRQGLGLRRDPTRTAVIGAARAGLISVLCTLNHPTEIGMAGAQSGYFTGRGYEMVVSSAATGPCSSSVYLDCGSLETSVQGQGSIAHASREIAATLRSRGCTVKFLETNEGHNWTAWRRRLPVLLRFLFGG